MENHVHVTLIHGCYLLFAKICRKNVTNLFSFYTFQFIRRYVFPAKYWHGLGVACKYIKICMVWLIHCLVVESNAFYPVVQLVSSDVRQVTGAVGVLVDWLSCEGSSGTQLNPIKVESNSFVLQLNAVSVPSIISNFKGQ